VCLLTPKTTNFHDLSNLVNGHRGYKTTTAYLGLDRGDEMGCDSAWVIEDGIVSTKSVLY